MMKKQALTRYTDFLVKETETLLNIDSPTGYTEEAAAWVKAEFEKLGFAAQLTNKGGVLVDFGGEGKENGLLDRIAADDKFGLSRDELEAKMNPADYVGRSPRQVEVYLRDFVKPVLDANKELLGATGVVNV